MSKKPETFGSAQGETKFLTPEGSELSRLNAKLDMLQTLVGRDEQVLGYLIQELRGKLRAAEASAAAMRSAIATAQRALDQYVILYDRTALASESETAMREAVADTAGQHLLDELQAAHREAEAKLEMIDELEGLRELVADNWLVWSNEHAAWWGPNERGYYTSIDSAGRYSFEDAARICKMRSPKAEGNPNELIQPSPEWIAALAALKARQ